MINYRHYVTASDLPNSKAAFRPKADSQFHLHVAENAEICWHNSNLDTSRQAKAATALRDKLIELYPPHHMQILKVYGQAMECKEVSFNLPSGWMSLPVETPFLLPDRGWSYLGLNLNPSKHSAANNWGVDDEFMRCSRIYYPDKTEAQVVAEERKKVEDYNRKVVSPMARDFLQTVEAFRDLHKGLQNGWRSWPANFKNANGRYPTWGEIRAEFPIVDEYMDSIESAPVSAMAEAA
jgi:hypothetical protein